MQIPIPRTVVERVGVVSRKCILWLDRLWELLLLWILYLLLPLQLVEDLQSEVVRSGGSIIAIPLLLPIFRIIASVPRGSASMISVHDAKFAFELLF